MDNFKELLKIIVTALIAYGLGYVFSAICYIVIDEIGFICFQGNDYLEVIQGIILLVVTLVSFPILKGRMFK